MVKFLKWIDNNSWKVLIGVIIVFVIFSYAIDKKYGSASVIDCTDAQSVARQFVKRQLKAPSTADFPYDDYEYECVEKTNNRWVVKSYVDAENSFGAKLRQKWWVEMKYKKSTDKWELLNIAVY